MKVSVIGCGSWGTAFARQLSIAGAEGVELVCRRPEQADAINRAHRNPDYLKDIELPVSIEASAFQDNRLSSADLIVVALPSRVYRDVIRTLAPRMNPAASVLSLTKGLEPGTLKRFSEVLAEELPQPAASRVLVLSGPNHAEEVARDVPTATALASHNLDLAREVQQAVATSNFRVYVNADLLGVELCGAIKNVIALAAGMCDGLGYGDNTKAALMTRGLAEMARLGRKLGASPETFYGLAGMGDLIATCTSRHSRNRAAGELIAQGRSPAEAEDELGMVAEGLTSAGAIRDVARREAVEMPITDQVCEVIYDGKDVERAVIELMARAPREE
jgi:glycerol-3-phosphate dehydrogenase (NAD(P)+)